MLTEVLMMSKKSQHIIKSPGGGWSIWKEGSTRATKIFAKQVDAIKRGIEIAKKQKTVLFVHARCGRVINKYNYE